MRHGASSRPGMRKRYYPHRRARPHFARTDKTSETAVRRDGKVAASDLSRPETYERVFAFPESAAASKFARAVHDARFGLVTRQGRFVEVAGLNDEDLFNVETTATARGGEVVARFARLSRG